MKTRKRKHKGGTVEEINVRQIFLTKPIKNEIKKEKNINLSEFATQHGEQGFRLHKMKSIKKLNYNSLIKREPIKVKKSKFAKKINGERKQLYELIDGRHRVARAITLGKKTIKADIQ